MANDLLGQLLGSVFANVRGAGPQGIPGNALGGAIGAALGGGSGGLGDLLGGLLAGGRGPGGASRGPFGLPGGGKGALMAVLLPLALQWVQRNGGIGAILKRFQKGGYTQQAASWVSTGQNDAIDGQAVADVLGADEISRLSQQLGVSAQEVSGGFAEILPEVVNQLTPQGSVPDNADDVLAGGTSLLEQLLAQRNPG